MNEKICRLCLQTIIKNNCQALDESLIKSLKLNLKIFKENVMCIKCANCLRVFSNFTSGCSYADDRILPLSYLGSGVQLDPEPIETTSDPNALMETKIKCSFCTKTRGREDIVPLRDSSKNKFLVNMLEQYISKKNLKSTEELLSCETCLEALQGVSSLILKGLEVEEKINKYMALEEMEMDDDSQVELKKVQQFMFQPIIKSEIESFGLNELEDRSDQVQEYTMMDETKIKNEKLSNTELVIKTEENDVRFEQSAFSIINIKLEQSDCDGFQEPLLIHKSPSKMNMFKCELCSYEAKEKCHVESHLLIHKSPSQMKMFKCESCSFETKHKGNLKHHFLTHKSPSEIKMFKCELCPYETKYDSAYKRHFLVHKPPSEMKMFKCDICSYEAKRKCRLRDHLLTHKSPSEIEMFKCELCPHETKYKNVYKRHSLMHKSPSEIEMFKCELCPYEAKRKSHIELHLLTHKNPSEIKMFKCELCPYQAKQKIHLKTHLLTHKSPSEIKMFKCELCPYEAKRKSHIELHLLTHKSPSEIKMFECELCSYKAKRKCYLKDHLLNHKSPLEIKMFKCEMCSYEAKRKSRLKQHFLLVHKGRPEIKM